MAERSPALAAGLLLLALVLAGAGWLDPRAAAVLVWLAQIPAALGIALLRRSRSRASLWADAGRLTLLWGGGFLLAGALLAWPLWQLDAAPSLGGALALGGMAGIVLVLLWAGWPRWLLLERRGGSAADRHSEEQVQERAAWSGLLQVALPAFMILAGGLLLAWPELLTGSARRRQRLLRPAGADAALRPAVGTGRAGAAGAAVERPAGGRSGIAGRARQERSDGQRRVAVDGRGQHF